jgi:hypothetical protein
MAKKTAKRGRGTRDVVEPKAQPKHARREKKNKIHVSLFVDGQDVTLIDEFNTPAEAIAACREFLDAHSPQRS